MADEKIYVCGALFRFIEMSQANKCVGSQRASRRNNQCDAISCEISIWFTGIWQQRYRDLFQFQFNIRFV